jgi:histone H3/H4
MSIKTRENLQGSEIQQQRQALAKAAVDRIIRETPRQISTEMYVREVALFAFAEGWNAKAVDLADHPAAEGKEL